MKRRKQCAAAAVTLLLSLLCAMPVYAGWESQNGNWYYYNSSGRMAQSQWLKSGTDLYWMNDDGTMAVNAWKEQNKHWYYLGSSGAAVSGWQEVNQKWYYFDKETHVMATEVTIDSWYVGKDGAWDPSK